MLGSQIDDVHKESNKKMITSRQAAKSLESGLRLLGSQIDDFHKESNKKMITSRQGIKSLESGLRLLGSQIDDFHIVILFIFTTSSSKDNLIGQLYDTFIKHLRHIPALLV